jgi:hypothetical protein
MFPAMHEHSKLYLHIFYDTSASQIKIIFQNYAILAARAAFAHAILLLFAPKNSNFYDKQDIILSCNKCKLGMAILHIFIDLFLYNKQKTITKKFATLAARVAFVSAFSSFMLQKGHF